MYAASSSDINKLHNNAIMESTLLTAGFYNIQKIADTLQGAIWQGSGDISSPNNVQVIKATNKYLHEQSIATQGNKVHRIEENIMTERLIMEYLSKKQDFPSSIVRYYSFFQTKCHYYICMEYGGKPLFDFILKGHQLISQGHIDISEWHKVIKIIFKQMVQCIEFIHKYNVCHMDISIENFLINDVKILEQHDPKNNKRPKITFVLKDIQVKCCDFGLAHAFIQNNDNFNKNNNKNKWLSNKFCGKQNYQSPEITARKQNFNAKSNDIWCLGVCLFMMIMGNAPWHIAHKEDALFIHIYNGNLKEVVKSWNKLSYINDDLLDLFQSFFKDENERISLKDIKNHSWLK